MNQKLLRSRKSSCNCGATDVLAEGLKQMSCMSDMESTTFPGTPDSRSPHKAICLASKTCDGSEAAGHVRNLHRLEGVHQTGGLPRVCWG